MLVVGAQNALLSVGIVLLWALWLVGAMPGFWLVLVIITLPLSNGLIRRAVMTHAVICPSMLGCCQRRT